MERGALCAGVVNVVDSTISRESWRGFTLTLDLKLERFLPKLMLSSLLLF
jgi:hypothetical protein